MVSGESFDIVTTILARWRVVVLCAALGSASGIAYGLLAPKWYAATLSVVPSNTPNPGLAAGLAARLPDALDTYSTDVQRIQAVLNSNSVADEVIDRFNLRDRYGTAYREHAREALRKHCSTSADRRSGLVTLTCEDTDPKRAMQMAAYFGEVGNRVFGRVSASSAREERRFLETQVVKARKDVNEASAKLREFQEKHRIVDLPEQSKAVISAMATLKGELVSKQLELSYLSSFSSRTESSVMQLRQQIGILNAKLAQLEASQSAAPSPASAGSASPKVDNKDFFPAAMVVPELRYELEQLLREQKIAETVFFLMTQRFEAAKIDEARNTSTFQILDHPTLPTSRARPSRKRAAVMGCFAGAAFAAAWVLLPVWWRRRSLVTR